MRWHALGVDYEMSGKDLIDSVKPASQICRALGSPPPHRFHYELLLNLAAVANADTKEVLWAYLQRYAPGVSPKTHPRLDALVGYAIRYFHDFVKPRKKYRPPTDEERAALADLAAALAGLPENA